MEKSNKKTTRFSQQQSQTTETANHDLLKLIQDQDAEIKDLIKCVSYLETTKGNVITYIHCAHQQSILALT